MKNTVVFKQSIQWIIALVLSVNLLYAQSAPLDSLAHKPKNKTKVSHEFFLVPVIIFNGFTLGFNFQTSPKIEHSFKLGSWIFIPANILINVNFNYNLNIYYRNRKNYLPLWFGMRNTMSGSVGFEEGYHPHKLRPSWGVGFGRKAKIFKRLIRIEAIGGASFNLTNGRTGLLPLQNWSGYSFDTQQPDQNPKIIPTGRLVFTFVR